MQDSKRDTAVKNSLLDSVGEGKGGIIWENSIETCILSNVKWIASPVWRMRQGAQGWCTGMTLRDGMGREVRGGFRMGNTCTLMADSCQCMAKPLQYCKVIQFSSVAQWSPTLCDSKNCSTPGLLVHHQLPELTQTHIHRVSDAIQPSHPLSSPSPPAPNPSQHQSLFQWLNSLHEVAKVLEFQL